MLLLVTSKVSAQVGTAPAPIINNLSGKTATNPFTFSQCSFLLNAQTGRPNVRRILTQVVDNSTSVVVYSTSSFYLPSNPTTLVQSIPTGAPATQSFAVNITNLTLPKSYTVIVYTKTTLTASSNPSDYDQSTSFTLNLTSPTGNAPVLVSPISNSSGQFNVDLCSDITLEFTSNNISSRYLYFQIYENGNLSNLIDEDEYSFNNNCDGAQTIFRTIPALSLEPNKQYLMELQSKDANQATIGQIYYTILTGPDKISAAVNSPSITSPANNSTVNSYTPVITLQSPFKGCTLNSVTYEILVGTSGNTVVSGASTTYTTPTYSWTVPVFLTAGNTYRARVTYNTANGIYSDIKTFTVSNTPLLTVSSPNPLTNLNPCGFTVTVARYPSASTVQVEYRLKPSGSFGTPFYSTDIGTAYQFTFNNIQLQANSSYEMRLTAGTGSGGSFVANSSSITLVDFTTANINNGDTKPTLSSPINGATDVSLTPTITFAPYTGDCGSVTSYIVTLVPVSEPNFDNGSNPDRVYQTSPTNGFVLGTALKPNTQYKIRISTIVSLNGSNVSYPFNYDNGSYTFTTIGSNLPATQITNVVDETYLNAISQTFTAVAVTGATSYEWQFSTAANFSGAIITKTSATNSLSFGAMEFVAGEHYYARVRGVSSASSGIFSTDPAEVVSFYNPLWGSFVTSPTVENLTTRNFGLKGLTIPNANVYYFQVALANSANDGNPIADFTAGNYFNNPTGYYSTTNYPGLTSNSSVQSIPSLMGPAFIANNFKSFSWGSENIVNYMVAQPQTRYRIRVVPVRIVGGQIVQQMELAYVPITTFGTNGIPDRLHTILGPTNGQTGVDNRISQVYTRITVQGLALFWDITNYQIQLSTTSNFSSGVISVPALDDASFTNSGTVGGVTQGNPVFDIPNLAFSTTYYVRARSVAVVKGLRTLSAWGPTVQFTTKASPARLGSQGAAYDITSVAFPNPFDQTVTLHINESHKQVTVRIHDMTGRLIETIQSSGGKDINLGKQYSKGMYLIFVEGDEQRETLKIVKQ